MKTKIIYIIDSIVFFLLSVAVIVAMSFAGEKYDVIIFLSYILLIVIILIVMYKFRFNGISKITKKINDKYHMLKEKSERTVFEECYVLSIKEELEKKLYEEVQINKLKEVGNIFSDITEVNSVNLYYRFRGFEVCINIEENDIYYRIDTPTRYDGLPKNEEFERINKVDFSPKEFYNIDSFIKNIYSLMLEINSDIETFSLENITDDNFNGRMFNKIKPYKDFLKREGLESIIFGSIFLTFLTIGLYFFISNDYYRKDSIAVFIIGLIFGILLIGVLIFLIIHGIAVLIDYIRFKDDFNNKNFSITDQRPYKVRLLKEPSPYRYYTRYGRSNVIYIRCIVLYFDKMKLYIPLNDCTFLKYRKNMKAFYDECLKIKTKFKYLTKSKIVFDGDNKYVRLLKEYLTD